MEIKSIASLQIISKISLYLLVFLIPIWFLPITQDFIHFQKQALLIILVTTALVAWLAKIVSSQELTIRQTWLYVPVGAVLFFTIIATLTSAWRYGSFWGWPLNVADSFLSILFFILFAFLVANVIKDVEELSKLLFYFFLSVSIACLYAILQLYQIFLIPVDFAKAVTFNTIGNTNGVAILASILTPLAIIMGLISKSIIRWWFWFFAAILFLTIVLINFSSAWIVLGSGLLILLLFGIWNFKTGGEFKWVSLPMVLLVITLFFLVFKVVLPGSPITPLEVFPSKGAQITMLKEALSQKPLFGSGPGTFVFDYAKYHQVALNQTIFWGTRFISGASEIMDWFMSKGIIGGLSFLAVMVLAILASIKVLLREKEDFFKWMLGLGLTSSFLAMIVAHAVYYSNFTLSFTFWFLLGSIILLTSGYPKTISIAPPSFLAVVFSFTLLAVLVLGVGILFVGGQKYAAEIKYLNGLRQITKGDNESGINKILSALQLNPAMDIYWRDLAQLYLAKANQIVVSNLTDEEKQQQIQVNVNNAVTAANQAVVLSPNNVENWNVRGFVYRGLIGFTGADSLAIESYSKAMELEPASPFSVTELGRVYIAQAQNLGNQQINAARKKEAIEKALMYLNKAIELKSDYAPAHYLVALAYGEQGNSQEQISKLEKTKEIAPNDIGLAFQLGVLHYEKADYAKAQAELERAKALNGNYANARYVLGLVYEKRGQIAKAIEEFKKVSELNPNNEQVKRIINNLNSGRPALSGIEPSSPPIHETPPEINNQ